MAIESVLIKTCPPLGGEVKTIGVARLPVYEVDISHLFIKSSFCSSHIEPGRRFMCATIGGKQYILTPSRSPLPIRSSVNLIPDGYEVTVDPSDNVEFTTSKKQLIVVEPIISAE